MNNESKMHYEEPTVDIILFNVEDVLTTSDDPYNGEIDPVNGDVVLPKVSF